MAFATVYHNRLNFVKGDKTKVANESLEVIVKSLPSISMPERLLPTGD